MAETKNEMYILYGIGIIAVLMLGWAFIGFVSPSQPSAENAQFQQASTFSASGGASSSDSECGDLNDISNVQHLGHHPDQFADCLKKVNPQVLKQATGQTLEELLGGY